jgi:MEMO1 family protein
VQELSHFPFFRAIGQVHDQEHSLEMQLPLIRQTLGDIPIVPLAVGSMADGRDIYLTGRVLRRYLKENDLVIVSSDFTHYGPRFDYQPFRDNIPENIKHLDQRAFECLERVDLEAFMTFREETRDTICGFFPCAILLSMLPANCQASLLKYRTSQQIVYDPEENSVSYLAIVFSNNDTSWANAAAEDKLDELTEEDGQALVKLAKQAIRTNLHSESVFTNEMFTDEQLAKFKKARGVFVTLYKKGLNADPGEEVRKRLSGDKLLRGCIGYIYPVKSLLQAVIDNSVSAANKDPRFTPVLEEELPDLTVEISVLTPPQAIDNWKQIRLGTDGIIMHKDGFQSVFLPKVATEFGWNLTETLTQLSVKAGCASDGWQHGAFFDVFQTKVFSERKTD